MNIDKNTLAMARQWAKDIRGRGKWLDGTPTQAVAEVIDSLPDDIVDLQDKQKNAEVIQRIRNLVDSWQAYVDKSPNGSATTPLSLVISDLEGLLPVPASAARVETKMGAWAMHPEHGEVLIVSDVPSPSDEVVVAYKDEKEKDRGHGFVSALVKHADLSPLPEDENDAESKFDPEYMYCDKDGDFWQYRDGLWKFATPWNLDLWMGSYNTLSDDFAPYARVEKEGNNE